MTDPRALAAQIADALPIYRAELHDLFGLDHTNGIWTEMARVDEQGPSVQAAAHRWIRSDQLVELIERVLRAHQDAQTQEPDEHRSTDGPRRGSTAPLPADALSIQFARRVAGLHHRVGDLLSTVNLTTAVKADVVLIRDLARALDAQAQALAACVQERDRLRALLLELRSCDMMDYNDGDGKYWRGKIDAALAETSR